MSHHIKVIFSLSSDIQDNFTFYSIPVQDDHRPWIRKEEKAFTDLLKRLGASLTRHLHASDSNVSNLFTHFEVLHGFKKYHLQLLAQQQHQQAVASALAAATAVENYKNNSNNSSSASQSSGEESETDK